jgi:hypothetical protein
MIQTFSDKFLKINFDQQLMEMNNPLINSQEHYINYKQKYMELTKNNLKTYTELAKQMADLHNLEYNVISVSKVIYTYIDKDKLCNIKQAIKAIEVEQQIRLNEFLRYIEHLNANYSKIVETSTSPVKEKSIIRKALRKIRVTKTK